MLGEILSSKGEGFGREVRRGPLPSPGSERWWREERRNPSSLTLAWWQKKKRKKRSSTTGITPLTVARPTTALADHKTASHIHVVCAARKQGTKHTTSLWAL